MIPAAREPHLPHELVNVPAATVHDDGLHAHEAKERDVARKACLERRIGHRAAAETNHQRLAMKGANVR